MNSQTQYLWHMKRLRAEKRFRWYGRAALIFSVAMLAVLLTSIIGNGAKGFVQTQIKLPVAFTLKADATSSEYNQLVQAALRKEFPAVTDHAGLHSLYALLSIGAGSELKRALLENPKLQGTTAELWLPASSEVDMFTKSGDMRLNDAQLQSLKSLQDKNAVRVAFNQTFFTHGDSRNPERAGFLGAIVGSLLTLAICLLVVFPIGVMTAVYLEEFARKGRLVDIVEVNVNNLAAVPSIVFGLLGLAVYINFFGMPRSAPLVAGLTLALMILPVIIITTRVSLSAVPPSVRDAARALGATPLQVVCHHVLPLSMPGIMTGTILGMARAIGETAPLLMIGMVAFVADTPRGFLDPATVMPVQIYLWASSPEAGFAEKTAAGILVLLVLLLALNSIAIILRRRFETRW